MSNYRYLMMLATIALLALFHISAFAQDEQPSSTDESEYQRLLKRQARLPKDSYQRSEILMKLSSLWIKSEVDALVAKGETLKISAPETTEPLPPELQNATPELAQCWRKYRAWRDYYINHVQSAKGNGDIVVQNHWALFYDRIADFFLHNNDETLARLDDFGWGGFCGTGIENFKEPRDRMRLIMLLHQRRYTDALAVWLNSDIEAPQLKPFLSLCGEDWERVFIGITLDKDLVGYGRPIHAFEKLVKEGSPRAARLLIEMANMPGIGNNEVYLSALAAFVTEGEGDTHYSIVSSRDMFRRSKQEIPQQLQQQILQILSDKINNDSPLEVLNVTAHLLARLHRLETKDAVRRAAAMPYQNVHYAASLTLRGWGEPVSKLENSFAPVKFRVLLNSQPFTSHKLESELKLSAIASSLPTVTTDKDGIFTLSRDLFIHPQDHLQRLFLGTGRLKRPDDLWFVFDMAPPENIDAITDINIEISKLKFELLTDQPLDNLANKEMKVRFTHVKKEINRTLLDIYQDWMTLPVSSEILFPALQLGQYQVEILLPGAAYWKSEVISLDSKPTVVPVQLEKGADLTFKFVPSGNKEERTVIDYRLWKDGEEVTFAGYFDIGAQTYRGLPVGKYRLIIPGTKDPNYRFKNYLHTHYQGRTIEFTIDQNSPLLIDLGEIRLSVAK